jgi:hypothetical protein
MLPGLLAAALAAAADPAPPYPPSRVITGLTFDHRTLRTDAPGSDLWPVTWAADGTLYTAWGDGGGFGGTNSAGRVSFGFGRVDGGPRDYRGTNLAGGKGAPHPAPFRGKSLGLLALGDRVYVWRSGDGTGEKMFGLNELWRVESGGARWANTGVVFRPTAGDPGFYSVAVCQFGPGYAGARDEYVYLYAPEVIDPGHWDIQRPGRVALFRVPAGRVEDRSAYEFFAGAGADGRPTWTRDAAGRKPVWEDARNGGHRIAVGYNPGLKRFLLSTMTVGRDGWQAVYDAPEPWGPWTTAYFARDPDLWGAKVIVPTFVNKWLSPDGRRFVAVFTRNDHWATVEGEFQSFK